MEEGLLKGYHAEQFTDAWDRYTPQVSVTSVTSASPAQKVPEFDPSQDARVTDSETGGNPHGERDVTDVTDRARVGRAA
jgi:hypothetical protein